MIIWLVVSFFSIIYGIILPIDSYFFRWVGIPPTSYGEEDSQGRGHLGRFDAFRSAARRMRPGHQDVRNRFKHMVYISIVFLY